MIDKIIGFSLKNKLIIGLFIVALTVWGVYSIFHLSVDAVPDITNNQVQIISVAPTLAANEVEQLISTPVELSVVNIPDVIELRSISRLGLSVVTVVFKENVDIYWARQQISERLRDAEENIPQGITKPELAPISTGLGEIYQYTIHRKNGFENKYSAMELRTIQDWIVRRQLLGTPGVADVNSYGGFLKQYEVAVNPEKLRGMNISLNELFEALEKNNQNTGSAYIDHKPNAYFIRGIGLVNTIEDIENIVVRNNKDGVPILVKDIAKVQYGYAPRYGAFVVDTSGEAVGGVVMMLKGSNASAVIKDVKKRIDEIQKSLPEGLEIEPYLDRTELVGRSVGTVSKNLIEGGLIVILVLVLLLGDLRAGIVVASVIPLSMLFAISLMNLFGVSGNLMSLGAIDFGLIVDGAVIIVESIVHRISHNLKNNTYSGKLTGEQMDNEVKLASGRMMNSATFGQIIILIVYFPILALVGIEGKMFKPMAITVSFAIIGAILLSLTYVPVASSVLLSRKGKTGNNVSDRIILKIRKVFEPILDQALKRKKMVVGISMILIVLSIVLYETLGGEFIPTLEEGDLAAGVVTLQGGSLSNTIETVGKANKILMEKFPEVKHVVCKIGAGEIPTDPTPMETGDYIIVMKDKKEWTSAGTREELMEKMEKELSVLAGVKFEFQQPIQMRFNELMSGSKQDIAVKIFGDNLQTLSEKAEDAERILQNIEGVEDINIEKVTGSAQIQVNYKRDKIAQYGLNIADINKLLKTAFAGSVAGIVYEGDKRFDLVVRMDKDFRQDIQYLRNLYIPLPSGNQITLEQVADVDIRNGIAQISKENARRRITIGFNVRNRDIESVISEVRKNIDRKLKLPAGYYVEYGGQFENMVAAKERLSEVVPIALFLIFILLFLTFRSVKQTLLIFSAVPLSAIGGVIALYLRGMPFSISAGVGFIALFGVAVLNGIVLIAEFNRLEKEKGITDIYERVRKGLSTRLRPVIITASVASLGFLPMAISTSAGAEVQKPLATVVIGGLISSTILTLIVLPILYIIFSGNVGFRLRRAGKISAFLILFMLTTGVMYAQTSKIKVYSLEEAIKHSTENNYQIKSGAMQVEVQRKLRKNAWDIGKTNIEYEYGQSNSLVRDNNITISQTLSFPSVYVNQSRFAEAQVHSSELQLNITRNEIVARVKSVYINIAYLYSKTRLLRYQDSLYAGFLRAAELRNMHGEVPLLEKAAAESQLMEIRTRISQTMSDIEIFKKELATLLNEKNEIMISDSVLSKMDLKIKDDSTAIGDNPYLSMLKQQVELSRLTTRIEQSRLMPDFSIGYFNQSNRDLLPEYRFTGIQAGIAVPLWFIPQTSKIQASRLSEKIAANNYLSSKDAVYNEFLSLIQQYLKYKNSMDYYENKALPLAELIIGQAGKAYSSGSINYVEYVQNMDKALEIKGNYLETLNSFNHSVIAIESITGNKLNKK